MNLGDYILSQGYFVILILLFNYKMSFRNSQKEGQKVNRKKGGIFMSSKMPLFNFSYFPSSLTRPFI